MSERLAFVKRWLDGERVVGLCREYGISRPPVQAHGRARGQTVGVREVEGSRCLVTFMQFDLGHYDFNSKLFEPNALPDHKERTAHRTRELLHLTSPLRGEC